MSEGTALVTGASSGIGKEIAKELAATKYDVVLVARRKDRLTELATQLTRDHGVRAEVIAADLGRPSGARSLADEVAKLGLSIDVLVNNAGFGVHGKFVEAAEDRTLEMIELNITSLTFLTQHYAKAMVARGKGRILQVSSIGAFQPSPYYAVYSATKSFVLTFSEAVHHELKGTGVTITTICPGLTETEFHEVADHAKPDWMKSVTMTANEVAKIGLKAMWRGKRVVVPGFANSASAFFAQALPNTIVIPMAAKTMEKPSA